MSWFEILFPGGGAALNSINGRGIITEQFIEFFAWVFDPTRLIAWGMMAMSYVFNLLGYMMPGDVGDQFQQIGDKLSAVPVQSLFAVAAWMMSPGIDPHLLLACVGIMLNAWVLSIAIKFVLYVKGHIWSAGH